MDRDPTTWSARDAGVGSSHNSTVEPKVRWCTMRPRPNHRRPVPYPNAFVPCSLQEGRLVLFTSAEENMHMVQPVTRGTRYAFTLGWTCDERKGITDFLERADEAHLRAEAKLRAGEARRRADAAAERQARQPKKKTPVVEVTAGGDVVD